MTTRSILGRSGLIAWAILAGCSSTGNAPTEAERLERGGTLYTALRCKQCHFTDEASAGGALTGIHGLPVTLADGRSVVRDDAYLVRAIRDPHAEAVAGSTVKMPRYPTLTDEDVRSLVAYLKELR